MNPAILFDMLWQLALTGIVFYLWGFIKGRHSVGGSSRSG